MDDVKKLFSETTNGEDCIPTAAAGIHSQHTAGASVRLSMSTSAQPREDFPSKWRSVFIFSGALLLLSLLAIVTTQKPNPDRIRPPRTDSSLAGSRTGAATCGRASLRTPGRIFRRAFCAGSGCSPGVAERGMVQKGFARQTHEERDEIRFPAC